MKTETSSEHAFSSLIDLASERLGGKALSANDEFFAPLQDLLKESPPIFIPGKFTSKGKWMDGWETRRRRTPGHDWGIIQLGVAGIIRGVNVNTAFFVGNYPEYFSLDAKGKGSSEWIELIKKTPLKGGTENIFPVTNPNSWTHVRLNIFPDGGVARLRIHGEVTPDWGKLRKSKTPIDLAAIANGGKVVTCNDCFFGPMDHLILPGRGLNMGDGWETRRKRGPGHDWIVVRLGATGQIKKVEVDTAHFKGNFPESCQIEGLSYPKRNLSPSDFSTSKEYQWEEILPRTKLRAHHRHFFMKELNKKVKESSFDYIRLNIFPDGGVSRLRLYGTPL